MAKEQGITIKKESDMPEWYAQVCQKSELADYAVVKGCMVIRPRGYAIWQKIQDYFNEKIIKPTNVQNAYFPLFIPESFFQKEAKHAEGFTPEVAWIDKEVTGDGERLAVRPTSETIMYDSYSRWIRSYKDLPLKLNQWCNVVRWETKATKLFLRSREFLWQEGHCVYETENECDIDTIDYIKRYVTLAKDLLAVPVIVGKKTEKEKFAGAKYTTTIEGFMPDGKALQMGTSHNLGQGFAKGFGIKYVGKDEQEHIPWQSSWGLSTRLIGGVVMTHSDNKGLVLPPKIAMNKVAIIPILFEDSMDKVLKQAEEVRELLKDFDPVLDDRKDYKPGFKFADHELKGVPFRIELGPKDLETSSVVVARRDTGNKQTIKITDLVEFLHGEVEQMQKDMYKKAKNALESSIVEANTWDKFEKAIKERKLVKTHFCGEPDCEGTIKDKTGGATSRCIPFDDEKAPEKTDCVQCGKPAKYNIYFSKSY